MKAKQLKSIFNALEDNADVTFYCDRETMKKGANEVVAIDGRITLFVESVNLTTDEQDTDYFYDTEIKFTL